jgi:hypothetical protein
VIVLWIPPEVAPVQVGCTKLCYFTVFQHLSLIFVPSHDKNFFSSRRMGLLVTLFMVLVNIFNFVTANAPKAEGLAAVETWVVSCKIHVFGILAE